MRLLHILILSCDKASELTERQRTGDSSRALRVQLWMHRGICAGCRAYEKQSARIDALLAERTYHGPLDTGVLEERIIATIATKGNTPS